MGLLNHQGSKYNAQKLKGKCEMCNEKMGEEIHHLFPQQMVKDQKTGFIDAGEAGIFHKNHPANLMSICEKCHLKIHHPDEEKNDCENISVLTTSIESISSTSTKRIRRKKTTKGYVLEHTM